MDVIKNLLQKHPEIAVFLTLALGFLIGKKKFGKFSLGVVTSTLLAGILIGQFDIKISPNSDKGLAKLEDPKIKAFFLVNPESPSSVAISQPVLQTLVELVATKRPELIILTDDVYGTFVRGFRSLMAELPHNTIGVHSYSKYFGCTGWRVDGSVEPEVLEFIGDEWRVQAGLIYWLWE